MLANSGLPLKKPISVWNKPLKADFKDLFKALGKAGIDASTGQWIGLAKDTVDVFAAVGLESQQPAELAWALIYNALSRAIYDLVSKIQLPAQLTAIQSENFDTTLELSLESNVFELTSGFFAHPEDSEIVVTMQALLKQWLESVGMSPLQTPTISRRLPTYFILALNKEWRERPEYGAIVSYISTPFAEANERLAGWQLYKAWLQTQIEAPMMFASFGLADVYVPLRAYFRRLHTDKTASPDLLNRKEEQDLVIERVVVDLETALVKWLHAADRNDAIRVISGDPGSGKSSFTKVFAARLAQQEDFPVLLVPLHLLNLRGDLIEEIDEFVRYGPCLKQNPLCPDDENLRILLILDGLDELSTQGVESKEVAQKFIQEVQNKINLFNQHKTRLQIIITGREIAIQSVFKDISNVLHVLPYYFDARAVEQRTGERFVDSDKLLEAGDQRHIWWKKYGEVSQQDYSEMPSDLMGTDLRNITAQPLPNYLVAINYVPGRLITSKSGNLNTVYANLIDAVYERSYENNRKHIAVDGLSKSDFLKILKEIAMSAWHGQGRTTTVKAIEARCEDNGLKATFAVFQEGAKSEFTRFLAAFYFRQNGVHRDEHAFEFTHKSFGEYLVAKRIITAMQYIQAQVERHHEGMESGWHSQEALLYWAKTCGPTRIDIYLRDFLANEVALCSVEKVAAWQKTLSNLISVLLHKGLSLENVEPPLPFQVAAQWAINSEESLLVLLNACAQVTGSLSEIKWPNNEAFGQWIERLRGQRYTDVQHSVGLCSLSYLDLSDSVLDCRDLREVNLEGACLTRASLRRTSLDGAILTGATLDEAVLEEAYLMDANLDGASLVQASLEGANLEGASLNGASLNAAHLDGVSLKNAQLRHVRLDEASLKDANLEGASVHYAHLSRAMLDGANLREACFIGAYLNHARLDRTRCEGLSLVGAILENASLARADLSGANLLAAKCDRASLDSANLVKTILLGASLEDADLESAICDGASLIEATLDRTNLRLANLSDIVWDEATAWIDLIGMQEAINIPERLKRELKI